MVDLVSNNKLKLVSTSPSSHQANVEEATIMDEAVVVAVVAVIRCITISTGVTRRILVHKEAEVTTTITRNSCMMSSIGNQPTTQRHHSVAHPRAEAVGGIEEGGVAITAATLGSKAIVGVVGTGLEVAIVEIIWQVDGQGEVVDDGEIEEAFTLGRTTTGSKRSKRGKRKTRLTNYTSSE